MILKSKRFWLCLLGNDSIDVSTVVLCMEILWNETFFKLSYLKKLNLVSFYSTSNWERQYHRLNMHHLLLVQILNLTYGAQRLLTPMSACSCAWNKLYLYQHALSLHTVLLRFLTHLPVAEKLRFEKICKTAFAKLHMCDYIRKYALINTVADSTPCYIIL